MSVSRSQKLAKTTLEKNICFDNWFLNSFVLSFLLLYWLMWLDDISKGPRDLEADGRCSGSRSTTTVYWCTGRRSWSVWSFFLFSFSPTFMLGLLDFEKKSTPSFLPSFLPSSSLLLVCHDVNQNVNKMFNRYVNRNVNKDVNRNVNKNASRHVN